LAQKVFQVRDSSIELPGTASSFNNGAGAIDCDSRRDFGYVTTIRGVESIYDTTKPSAAFGGIFSA
jgi:hypothetical protein